MKTNLQSVLALCAAPLLAGCVSSGGGESAVAPEPELVFGVDRFPNDGSYQVDPVLDASFGTILNNVRLDNGAGPVTYNALLDQAAQGHANDMVANDYFSHIAPDGSRVDARVTATGYKWKRVAENIAQGQTSEKVVLNDWVNSPAHHASQINPVFEEFGIGRAGTGRDARWVLVLADPK